MNTNSYYGGKGADGTFQTIINQIPKCDFFIETHAGFASISRKMDCSSIIILNDINPKVCEVLKEKFSDRIIVDAGLWHSILIDAYCSINEKSGSPWHSKWILQYRTNELYGACKNGFLFDKTLVNSYKEHIMDFFDTRSKYVIIENLDAVLLLESYRFFLENMNSVIFSDPPYPLKSRRSSRKVYDFELEDGEHLVLLSTLRKIKCKQLITTYPNPLYEESLFDHRLIEYFSITRKGSALENLFLNFEKATKLNSYQYLGRNFRERETLLKYKRNFVKKFKSFPPELQNAIIEEIL